MLRVPALCASAAAVPAVAFAATDDNQTDANVDAKQVAASNELRNEAKFKLESAVERAKHERRKKLRAKARKRAQARQSQSAASPQLEAIAACESGGNPSAIGGGGAYRGKYQFD